MAGQGGREGRGGTGDSRVRDKKVYVLGNSTVNDYYVCLYLCLLFIYYCRSTVQLCLDYIINLATRLAFVHFSLIKICLAKIYVLVISHIVNLYFTHHNIT